MFFSTANQFFKKNQHWQKNHSNEKNCRRKRSEIYKEKVSPPPSSTQIFLVGDYVIHSPASLLKNLMEKIEEKTLLELIALYA